MSAFSMYIRLLGFLKPYRLLFVAGFACMGVYAIANGAMAYLVGPVMKFLFSSAEPSASGIDPFGLLDVPRDYMLAAVPIAIMLVALVKAVGGYGQTYFMGFVSHGVIRDIRSRLYRHIITMPVGYFGDTPTGTIISRITSDVTLLQSSTATAMTEVLKQSLTIIVLAIVVLSLDWKLALIASVAMPLAVYPMRKLGKKIKSVSGQGQVTMGVMTSLLHEAVAGVRIVKAFCMEGYETGRFERENERFMRFMLRTVKVRSLSSPIMEALGAFAFALTIWYAAYRISTGTLSPEAFISFFASVIMLYQPIKALNGVNLNIQQGLSAAVRIFDVLDTPSEAQMERGTKELDRVRDSIEFRGVSFGYGSTEILRDVTLKVDKGATIAIVGASGAGKTTFVNLIPRFYDPTVGSVLIDGEDIRSFTLRSLRSSVGIVSQQVVLFNDTVRNNIAYGGASVDMDAVIRAAKLANAHDFITRLANGYDTMVGEGGVRLSGGERQRLSIARAILKGASILILDEATSSLDSESENEVQKGLANLMEGKTTFVIAHRLSTVRGADKILVLGKGRIVEAGTHEELLLSGGEYARLCALQFNV